MPNHSYRAHLLELLNLPAAGRRIVLTSVKNSPVRRVRSRGGNVLTYFQSRKMGRTIGTESRHLEFPAAVQHEYSEDVIEYYEQPIELKFDVIDSDGEVHAIDHTPDFLVITERGIWFEEWKPWAKLESRAKRVPWRYCLDPDNRWSAPLIEQWLADRGIGYRIYTDRDIPQQRVENTLYLEDFLDQDAKPCPLSVATQVKEALVAEPALFLAALYQDMGLNPGDVLKLIADGELVADLDGAALADPTRCRVFRDKAVRRFELARLSPSSINVSGVVQLSPNTQIIYNERPYTVVVVGADRVILKDATHESVEIDIKTVEQLIESGSIHAKSDAIQGSTPSLANRTQLEITTALSRHEQLGRIVNPNRSQRRYLQRVATARLTGSDEIVALLPNFQGRGNREPRLNDEQVAAIDQIIQEHYLRANAANLKHCHRLLKDLCNQQEIKTPSYPTLISRIKALPQQTADRARHGNRVAYQNSEFVHEIYADTPIHGSRAFQYVHMDHTQIDIELISSTTGQSQGRPWLSLAIDAFTRRIVGIYLSYDPPSYRSNMMLLRDIVRRHKQLPQFIVADNGADFRSTDFESFCALMQIHVRFRPAGRPRHGAIMERIFGRLHSEYVHNLAGNSKALKNVRLSTGKFLLSRLAEWSLELLYYGVDFWAFTYYDQAVHSVLGVSPKQAHDQSMHYAGERPHRIVTLTRDFMILSCPTVDRKGERSVDHQRGIKVHSNYFYWCPEFRDPKLRRKKVPVRYDPWDISTVYVQIDDRWVPARCKALVHLGKLTEKERELVSDELRSHYRLASNQEPTEQQLAEFLRTFTPNGAKQLQLDRQKENRELYGQLGIGAVSGPTKSSNTDYDWPELYSDITTDLYATAHIAPDSRAPKPYSTNEYDNVDLPDLDTF